jgi:hypothetical protein
LKGITVTSAIVFKQRKNKRFNYTPRFQKAEKEKPSEGFEAKWSEANQVNRRRSRGFKSLPVMIVMLIAVLILMYILNGYM